MRQPSIVHVDRSDPFIIWGPPLRRAVLTQTRGEARPSDTATCPLPAAHAFLTVEFVSQSLEQVPILPPGSGPVSMWSEGGSTRLLKHSYTDNSPFLFLPVLRLDSKSWSKKGRNHARRGHAVGEASAMGVKINSQQNRDVAGESIANRATWAPGTAFGCKSHSPSALS